MDTLINLIKSLISGNHKKPEPAPLGPNFRFASVRPVDFGELLQENPGATGEFTDEMYSIHLMRKVRQE